MLLHSECMAVVAHRGGCDDPDIGSAHLKAGKEAVELLCQGSVTICNGAPVASVIDDLLDALPCPPWVVVVEVVLNPTLVSCFGISDASLQTGSCSAAQCSVAGPEGGNAFFEESADHSSTTGLLVGEHPNLLVVCKRQ